MEDTPPPPPPTGGAGSPTILQGSLDSSFAPGQKTPSELAGIIVLVGIMLIACLTAVDILEIQALKTVVGTILLIASQVLIALVIFAVGLYLANFAFNLINSSGTKQANFLAQAARISIMVLVSAMALQQMGIAPNIINLAFGLLVGGISVAIALAFGLGGREIAGEQLREWINSFKRD
jgi:Kef-type K+ transport system membrane component KefB